MNIQLRSLKNLSNRVKGDYQLFPKLILTQKDKASGPHID
jgi:hypothetical protein